MGESIIRTTSLIIRTRLNVVSPDYVGKRVVRTRSLAYRENSELMLLTQITWETGCSPVYIQGHDWWS